MTQQQFDSYMEHNGFGISSENGNVAYISNAKGDVVAMYWRGETNYLETLDEPITEKDPLNPLTWETSQWRDAAYGLAVSAFVLAFYLTIAFIFA